MKFIKFLKSFLFKKDKPPSKTAAYKIKDVGIPFTTSKAIIESTNDNRNMENPANIPTNNDFDQNKWPWMMNHCKQMGWPPADEFYWNKAEDAYLKQFKQEKV